MLRAVIFAVTIGAASPVIASEWYTIAFNANGVSLIDNSSLVRNNSSVVGWVDAWSRDKKSRVVSDMKIRKKWDCEKRAPRCGQIVSPTAEKYDNFGLGIDIDSGIWLSG